MVAQTSYMYILQFLWRDLTSNYDIIGPYFTSADSVVSKFILTCVLETIKLFQHHIKSLLVCDGYVANLTPVKATHEHCGAYSILDDIFIDRFEIKPWFMNPFSCILDNMHHAVHICAMCIYQCFVQLKNIINAFFVKKW